MSTYKEINHVLRAKSTTQSTIIINNCLHNNNNSTQNIYLTYLNDILLLF